VTAFRWILAAALALAPSPLAAKSYGLGVVVRGTKGKVRAADGIQVEANVTWSGPKATFRYAWSSLEGPALPSTIDTSQKKLALTAADLEPGERYRLGVRVVADYVDEDEDGDKGARTTEATGEVTVEVNAPPRGGRCTLEVDFIAPATARIRIEAPGWKDDDRIHYRWWLVRNQRKTRLENWRTTSSLSKTVPARTGDTLQAVCDVRDELGDLVTAESEAKTRP
jgi:hypothetical protein